MSRKVAEFRGVIISRGSRYQSWHSRTAITGVQSILTLSSDVQWQHVNSGFNKRV